VGLAHGSLGEASHGDRISDMVAAAFPITLQLTFIGIALAVVAATVLGVVVTLLVVVARVQVHFAAQIEGMLGKSVTMTGRTELWDAAIPILADSPLFGYGINSHFGAFIPGFEDQLIGAKIGEARDVNVTFPEEYHSKDLAGKPAKFECTVHSIKERQLPELDDEFAKKVSKFQTVEELRADIRKNLEHAAQQKADNDYNVAVIEKATGNMTADIPAVMIENRVTMMIQEMAMRLEQQGMKIEQYLQYAGVDLNQIREQYKKTAEENVRTDLMLEAVAKAEGIKVEARDLDQEVYAMAISYGATPKQVQKIIKEQGRVSDLAATVLRKKTAQFIVDNITA